MPQRVVTVRRPVTVLLLLLTTVGIAAVTIWFSGKSYSKVDPIPFENVRHLLHRLAERPVSTRIIALIIVPIVANILLFVPLGFLAMAALCADRRRAADLWAVPTAVLCVGFSALLEFLQLYFPPRTSSLNDIVAESIGAGLGIALWVATGRPLTRGSRAAWAGTAGGGAATRLLIAYLVLLALVQVFPPNLTLSPVELYHKYKAGLVRPVPSHLQR